jgi:hypothetical protein
MTDDELLNYLYHTKKMFGGVQQLYAAAKIRHPKIKKSFVQEWINKQKGYQLNKIKKVGKNIYLPIYSETPYSFQIDLTFFPRYKKYNKDNYVLFTAININTRFAYAYYSKDKESKTILDMLKKMEGKTIINSITCDKGSEFNNNEFIKYCKDNEIVIYFVKDDSHKLGIINRFHRTIKEKLQYYISDENKLNWIDVIDDIIYNYNHSKNRGIGIEPYRVNNAIETIIINSKRNQTEKLKEKIPDEFKVGDSVRVLRKKKTYEDKLMNKYHDIIFKVVKVKNNSLVIEDDEGNEYTTKKKYCFVVNPDPVEYPKVDSAIIQATKDMRINKELRKLK